MVQVLPRDKDNDDEPLCPDHSSSSLAPVEAAWPAFLRRHCRCETPLARECMAEFFSTFVLMGFGGGSGTQVALSNGRHGNYTHITLCWGIAVMLGVHVAGTISGAHMNPAVSFTFAVFGKLPWRKLPWYALSQVGGAFAAAWVIFLMYYPALTAYDPDFSVEKSGQIFISSPQATETLLSAFTTEVLCAAFLVIGVFAIAHPSNIHMNAVGIPIANGLLVVGLGMAFGLNTGYAVNPATDFGCRLFALLAGWGPGVFQVNDGYWWVPIVAPCLGGVVGATLFTMCIEAQLPLIETGDSSLPKPMAFISVDEA
ncbi:Aste57867_12860 [Aphanomyces stellatus]|uniref:Aste57867_12860 protein n=1 Tax=Aphanomyces stellatus TaxID=120398 RepID=A0A485KWQ8_9STRA|nr:hypothetical protein As57867_012812 [Aphanomyces stellatus]VFT89707.1 Aste57867_12860 [Aphanomyces stellatus]